MGRQFFIGGVLFFLGRQVATVELIEHFLPMLSLVGGGDFIDEIAHR